MDSIADRQFRALAVGDSQSRRRLIVTVAGLLAAGTAAFLLGLHEGFIFWIAGSFAVAAVAGALRAGVVPGVAATWSVSLWSYTFPPLVGYVTGAWGPASRYSYPRMAAFAYGSARAELRGGLEASVTSGLRLAVAFGVVGYVVGYGVRRTVDRAVASG
ncbi:hypothetical protein ACFQMA_07285 [Halosimplex aquaticum]|uniref:DUF2062 domain-containing protein n=1 Tax=Halosimplex aquaticum TaxID=3026162 RepID=A0ABD5Y075_9EURY|nr:hypothetical protein [Halosimplex aquaticum]